ncbi:MAG TPA: 16S rRNA (adenine(1518)-N(6)/adenine(1519)-N(6))-dimethyltransferase RsmA [Candidatus Saccharimonadales bacterium]|nr:16S rRNA (adenine(1518)-N(6)/adenine(1519)-N(6))-dimethyltransferase RsmA [Candidatus Saccharimonadales bacterium]
MVKPPEKRLGQHWLGDRLTLSAIAGSAELTADDTVLEVGPGQGNLTAELLKRAGKVVAVEVDKELADDLPRRVPADNLRVVSGNILKFDLTKLPPGYKVVANIPYYLTSNLLKNLSESSNPPALMVLLVQKEVAERIGAGPGQMSLLAVSVQLYYRPKLGQIVPSKLFTPPPKVDSQVIVLKRRPSPLFENLNNQTYFRLVKAGFAGKRKKLRSSLSAGLNISKEQADLLLKKADIDPDLRAQSLSLQDWHKIYQHM